MDLPAVKPVDLGRGDYKGCFIIPKDLERFNGLRLESLVNIHHYDGHIGQRTTPCTEGGKRMVTGSINKKQPRNRERKLLKAHAHPFYRINRHNGGPYVLGDSAILGAYHR